MDVAGWPSAVGFSSRGVIEGCTTGLEAGPSFFAYCRVRTLALAGSRGDRNKGASFFFFLIFLFFFFNFGAVLRLSCLRRGRSFGLYLSSPPVSVGPGWWIFFGFLRRGEANALFSVETSSWQQGFLSTRPLLCLPRIPCCVTAVYCCLCHCTSRRSPFCFRKRCCACICGESVPETKARSSSFG